MTLSTTERFDIGRVIARMFGVIGRNAGVFAALAVLLSGLPTALMAVLAGGVLLPLHFEKFGISGLEMVSNFGWVVRLLVSNLLQAALIHGVIRDLNGERPTVRACLTTALDNVLPLIAIGIVVGFAVILGVFFFIIPGVIIALALSVSAPVRVVERAGVFAALGRSRNLTRNHRGAMLLLFLFYWVLLISVQAVANAVVTPVAVFGGAAAALDNFVAVPVVGAFTALIGAAGIASIYFELRTVKEGIGIEALAAVFD